MLLFILMLAEFNRREGRMERRVKAIYRRFCKAVEDIISLGQATGGFRNDVNTRELASVVVALTNCAVGAIQDKWRAPYQRQGALRREAATAAGISGLYLAKTQIFDLTSALSTRAGIYASPDGRIR